MTYNPNIFFSNLNIIFGRFPRVLGLKSKSKFRRIKINSFEELVSYIYKYNSIADLYSSIYDLFYGIDKIVFDLDSPNIQDAYVDTCLLVDKLKSDKIPYLIVFSGQKGFHVYALFKYWRPPNKDTAIVANRALYHYFLSEVNLKTVDVKLIGDVSRVIRIPNTKHTKTGRYAIPLPPSMCDELTVSDIISMSRDPKPIIIAHGVLRDPREYIDLSSMYAREYATAEKLDLAGHSIPKTKREVIEMLKPIIRPCILYIVSRDPEPPHDIRTYFVEELVWLGYSVDEIVDIIRRLNWIDLNERITRYHVNKIYEKIVKEGRLFPPTCKTLRDKGYCLRDKCPTGEWYYWWGNI